MSEIIVAPGTTTPQLGLLVNSIDAIRLDQAAPNTPVTATGSVVGDTIVAASITDPLAFTLLGEAGDDVLGGAAASDTIAGGLGSDQIVGNAGNDVLTGGAGADTIEGGTGADRINAGPGNDDITPGPGRNIVTTGSGRDTIRIDSTSGGLTRITDFSQQDQIEISQQILRGSGLRPGRLKASDFRSVQSVRDLADDEAARIIYERSTGYVYYNRDNGRDVRLFQIGRNLNISASDFEIF